MGWSGGTYIMEGIVEANRLWGSTNTGLKNWYLHMINVLTDADWDNLDECYGLSPILDEAIDEYYTAMGYEKKTTWVMRDNP